MAQTSKAALRKNLEGQLRDKHLDTPVYRAQVEQYLTFHDRLRDLNNLAVSRDESGKKTVNLDAIREARQVSRTMREILVFLGLKPPEEGAVSHEPPPL